eukprot:TRINITY_DN8659_c0_g1_i3.p1 TRINITY_DN8659_c0_g1~~TRINITY_DN8659_c0_g1_i3.p1  ORF type:complete len:606 (+),score=67.48 TRINITY_DN8659_c0_g1_i3:107-1924(+)
MLKSSKSTVDTSSSAIDQAVSDMSFRTMKTTIGPPEAPTDGFLVSFTVFLGIVALQGGPFLFFRMTRTCELYDHEVPLYVLVLCLSPLYVCQWVLGGCWWYVITHRGRLRKSTVAQLWSFLYLILTSLSSVPDSFQVVWRCSSGGWIVDFFEFVWLQSMIIVFLSWLPLAWLCVLKLRFLHGVAPTILRVGSAVAAITFISCPVCCCLFVYREVVGAALNTTLFFVSCVAALSFSTLNVCVLFALEFSARASLQEATHGGVDGETLGLLVSAAKWARTAEIVVTISAASTVFYMLVAFLFAQSFPFVIRRVAMSVAFLLDVTANAWACMLLSGILDSKNERSSSLIIQLGVASDASRRFREIRNEITAAAGASTGSALVVAAAIGSANADEVLANATARFRCVRWEVLATRPDVIIGGAPLDVLGPGGDDLYSLSEPCELGSCDCFFSHSWHDDSILKWAALVSWCEQFAVENDRFPRLWIDKVCIRQESIDADLKCLPVFLAGCNTMFAASGSTYHTRLWCLVEMLIYRAMLSSDSSRSPPQIWLLGNSDDDCEVHRQGWLNFSVEDCECFKASDKERFLRVVSAYPGKPDSIKRSSMFCFSVH